MLGIMICIQLLVLAGIPLLAVFISELVLMASMTSAAAWPAITFFLVAYIAGLTGYIRLFYTTRIARGNQTICRARIRATMLASLTILGASCILAGILSSLIWNHLALPAGKSLMAQENYMKAFLKYASMLG